MRKAAEPPHFAGGGGKATQPDRKGRPLPERRKAPQVRRRALGWGRFDGTPPRPLAGALSGPLSADGRRGLLEGAEMRDGRSADAG